MLCLSLGSKHKWAPERPGPGSGSTSQSKGHRPDPERKNPLANLIVTSLSGSVQVDPGIPGEAKPLDPRRFLSPLLINASLTIYNMAPHPNLSVSRTFIIFGTEVDRERRNSSALVDPGLGHAVSE